MNKVLGIILIVLGLVGLAWGGFSYTTRHKVFQAGPLHATTTQHHYVPVAPLAGVAALVAGVVLLVVRR